MRLDRLRIVLWMAALIATIAFTVFQLRPGNPILATTAASTFAPTFRLADGEGRIRDSNEFRDRWLLVFFGFTNCPDVCPTTLGDIASWQEEFAAKGKPLRAYLVTVDPERDTPERLRDYVSWVPGVVGVTGAPDEVAKAVKAFRVYARKVQTEDGYTMDHSAMVLLFDAEGRYAGLVGYQEDPARTRATLEALLGA